MAKGRRAYMGQIYVLWPMFTCMEPMFTLHGAHVYVYTYTYTWLVFLHPLMFHFNDPPALFQLRSVHFHKLLEHGVTLHMNSSPGELLHIQTGRVAGCEHLSPSTLVS